MSITNSKIYKTLEVKILIAGLFMLLLLAGIIAYSGFTDIERSKTLVLALIAHTFGGRAAGIGLCIINGLSPLWTIVYNFYIEVLIVCFTYSIFVLSLNNYIKIRWVETLTANLIVKADKHKEKIRKYGWVGVFLFVMFPLPVTGPVVGSSIGYLLKMGVWRNLSAVFLGTLAAIVAWTIGFDFLEQHVHILQYVIIGILLIVLVSHLGTIKKSILRLFGGKRQD